MPVSVPPLAGEPLLDAVTDVMVAFHKRYYHREPATAVTRLLEGELLVCIMGGVFSDVEKTLIELQRSVVVQETRSAFQAAMQHKFIDEVERLSGRRVLVFISNSNVGPDLELELFLLAGTATPYDESGWD